jgi:hypothetical protein
MVALLWMLVPFLQGDSAEEDGWTVRLRALMTRTLVKTDSREYDSGDFSGTLDLHDDTDLPRWTGSGTLELENPHWRFSLTYTRMRAEHTLEEPLTFEEITFPAGTQLHTEFAAGWMDALYRLDLGVASPDAGRLGLLLGVSAVRLFFDFEGNGAEAREGHSELWPVPAVGAEGGWNLGAGFSMRGRFLASRFAYENVLHPDGGSDPKVVLGFFRGELCFEWSLSDAWTISAGLQGFSHHLRDTSDEDRHRVWFEGLGGTLELAAAF